RLARCVMRMRLVHATERRAAFGALRPLVRVQCRIQAGAPIEHEALALEMSATARGKVFLDTAFELKDLLEPGAHQEGRSCLATQAAGAEDDDRLAFRVRVQPHDRTGEDPELPDAGRHGTLERAGLHFVIVARIEERDGPTFVEPLLELAR